jgi:dTDP-4-amino-4,6-dideoxygalactose transaminase
LKNLKNVRVIDSSKKILKNSHYCLAILLDKKISKFRMQIVKKLNNLGIGTSIYYPIALPESTFYSSNPSISRTISSENASKLANANIALGVGPHLEPSDMVYVAGILLEVLKKELR